MRYLFIVFLWLYLPLVKCQTAFVIIDKIVMEGNKKTQNNIITRELTFSAGDTILLTDLSIVLDKNRLRLMNTNLFNVAQVNVKNWGTDNHVTVTISVIENWYLYPIPIFEIIDRNFNVWWTEQRHSLSRVNYGMRLTYINTTGQRDPLTATALFGYTPRYGLSYEIPYINKKQTIGVFGGISRAINKEVSYATVNNRLVFYKNPTENISERFGINLGTTYTPGLLSRHVFSLSYSQQSIDTVIAMRLNRDYFLNSRTQQRYFGMAYTYSHDTRDQRPYPLKGHFANFSLSKTGILPSDDVNILDLSVKWAQYLPISKKLSWETIAKTKVDLLGNARPYAFQHLLGFGSDYVRGYELYVVDGASFGLLKNSLHYELLNKNFNLSKYIKWKFLKGFVNLPVKCYLSANFDAAYANTRQNAAQNPLSNRPLYGGGVGLDFVVYYSWVCQLEYSWNDLGQKGFFLHYKVGI